MGGQRCGSRIERDGWERRAVRLPRRMAIVQWRETSGVESASFLCADAPPTRLLFRASPSLPPHRPPRRSFAALFRLAPTDGSVAVLVGWRVASGEWRRCSGSSYLCVPRQLHSACTSILVVGDEMPSSERIWSRDRAAELRELQRLERGRCSRSHSRSLHCTRRTRAHPRVQPRHGRLLTTRERMNGEQKKGDERLSGTGETKARPTARLFCFRFLFFSFQQSAHR